MHTPGTVRIQNNLHISKSFHMSYAIFLFRREHILSPLSISLSKYVYIHTLTYINHAFITHTHTQWETQKGKKRKEETGWFTLRFTGCKLGAREGEKASTAQINIEVHVLYDSYHDSLN